MGVWMSDRLEFTPHVNHINTAAVQSTYARRVLRAHGLNGPDLWESLGPLLWLNSRMYACLVFWWKIFHSFRSARSRTVTHLCRYCRMKNTCYINSFRPWGMYLIPFAQGLITERCQSQIPPWERISFIACCIWTHIHFLIVLVITWIFMNSSVMSVNFNFVFRCWPSAFDKGFIKAITYIESASSSELVSSEWSDYYLTVIPSITSVIDSSLKYTGFHSS